MTHMNTQESVRAQYAREGNLTTRRSVWQPTADGRDPATEAARTIAEARPRRVLEVGCGTGAFAERLVAENPDAEIVATDQSERFVELTAARGVEARVADLQDLPFPDDSFDVVAAMWMLYHVPDLDRGLAEVRRVLRPGGLFVAVTNGDEHTAGLRREAGGEAMVTQFSSENGEQSLRRHFDQVTREEFATRAVFPDHAAAEAYLASMQDGFDWRLPHFEGSKEYAGHVTLFAVS
ncbi:ubiquinone/menaquinone biosynthesis C-methylase UbiE [Nocardioides ginsengisegetis]|uniref:Ubiquinone/menaquinone biosynthesis C-methylase UbiE n=2 Tax=Nocardioides ginsengisegetis TaxID=661491 RepID=A0A7W3PAK6_9ACTN|nr:ubiquinone/menaquinone biosynthesis C-methylase UbiE [Nocardioides ginsengisegetis]